MIIAVTPTRSCRSFCLPLNFAMRLSLGKRRDSSGKMPWGRAIRRILGLAIVAIVWYSICDIHAILKAFREKPAAAVLVILFKREYFQTLLHIAATSLWILPVVVLSSRVRFGYAIFSGLLHLVVSWWFNFVWVNSDPMRDRFGGPLGFLPGPFPRYAEHWHATRFARSGRQQQPESPGAVSPP